MLNEILSPLLEDKEIKGIINDVLGTSIIDEIERLIVDLVNTHLETQPVKYLFVQPSAGVVFGIQLATGKDVVLKVFNKNCSLSYLSKMNEVQKIFSKEKFPAPQILSSLFIFNKGYGCFYQLLKGIKENGHEAVIREELAKGLADFSKIIDKYNFEPINNFMQEQQGNNLWPPPHNILFDLENTKKGAEWIEEKANIAKGILMASNLQPKLAYTDWDVKNTIFINKKLVGIFDWDSLGSLSELEMIGGAAAQFTADWESKNKITPTPEEGRLFLDAYQKYRAKEFSENELKIISAAADYRIAVIARLEHAGSNFATHPFQDLLRECGNKSFLCV